MSEWLKANELMERLELSLASKDKLPTIEDLLYNPINVQTLDDFIHNY